MLHCRDLKSVMTNNKLLFRMLPRKNVLSSLREHASTWPSLCLSLNLLRSVLMFPRRSAPDPEPTQDQSRSQLWRSGATLLQRSLASPKKMQSTLIIVKKTSVFHCHHGSFNICINHTLTCLLPHFTNHSNQNICLFSSWLSLQTLKQ